MNKQNVFLFVRAGMLDYDVVIVGEKMIKYKENSNNGNSHLLKIKPDIRILEFHKNPMWPFISCFNMILKSIFDYYMINEIVSYVQNGFAYEFIENEKRLAFSYTVIPFIEKDSLTNMNVLGFVFKNYDTNQECSIELIKEIINKGHPIMCMLDIYYLEGRELYYHHHHGGHYVLITGYNDEKETVYLMDNVEGYAIYECSYKEMEFYIKQTRLMEGGRPFNFLWEIIYERQYDTHDPIWIKNVIIEYENNLNLVKAAWSHNCEEIDVMINRLDDLLLQKEFPTNIESLIYRKNSELYSYMWLKQNNYFWEKQYDRICELEKSIIGKWKAFERLLMYKMLKKDNRVDGFLSLLREIQSMEKELFCLRG